MRAVSYLRKNFKVQRTAQKIMEFKYPASDMQMTQLLWDYMGS